jgi:hypothetical protein
MRPLVGCYATTCGKMAAEKEAFSATSRQDSRIKTDEIEMVTLGANVCGLHVHTDQCFDE